MLKDKKKKAFVEKCFTETGKSRETENLFTFYNFYMLEAVLFNLNICTKIMKDILKIVSDILP